MSASSKKKLRKEQTTAQMTEKQLAEQKEAKKLKLYTAAFVAVVAIVLVVAIVVGATQTIANSGIREKNTVALTVGEHKISNAELNYYFIDSVNNFKSQYGTYAAMFGMDVTKPLDEQVYDEATGMTWADYFLASAKDSVLSVYALNDAAAAAGHTLTAEEQGIIDSNLATMEMYGVLYGYEDGESYLKAMYGRGASSEGYRKYMEMSALADSYYGTYGASLTYTDADYRAAEAENFNAYSSYTYNHYYLATNKFLTGGTTAEDGTVTYSDEERAAAEEAAEAAANSLVGEEITSVEALDEAIAALSINAETTAASTLCENYGYNSVTQLLREWVTDDARAEGDMTVIPNVTTDADGKETTSGYYVVRFQNCDDNTFALKNVRHILVKFEGGTTDEATGTTTYTVQEKEAAKTAAEELLATWKAGEATEDSFAALANEHSDDGDGTTGGLYTYVYPGHMVANFNDWCFDASRTTGETGVIETEYGYHVMYFVGDSDLTYRDYQIRNELLSADLESWYTGLREAVTVTEGNTQYLTTSIVLGTN